MSINNKERLRHLMGVYASGLATDGEINELSAFLAEDQFAPEIKDILEAMAYEAQPAAICDPTDVDKMINRILKESQSNARSVPISRHYPFAKLAAAAAILTGVIFITYFFVVRQKTEMRVAQKAEQEQFKPDVAPGVNTAYLTLSDGSIILLDSAANGKLAKHTNIKVLKIDDGQLALTETDNNKQTPVKYNVITTPRGGQYQIILPDGSKVWLNAASSLKFPSAFSGKERVVELTGEAYFEIARNERQPFQVNVNSIEVQVLGTHFNINSYEDEATIKTTLLEGSVRETTADKQQTTVITPGQQAQFGKDKVIKVVSDVDVNQVIAWQKGLFEFNNSDLATIMRQVGRWYNVDVVYVKQPGDAKFGGGISKNLPLSDVLKLLQSNGVAFQLQGRVLTVTP